jgi:hypothetical protein
VGKDAAVEIATEAALDIRRRRLATGPAGEAISLVCADAVDLLAAIETLIRKVLPREEEEGFEPDHRVPLTGITGAVAKKPKKPKRPKIPVAGSRPAVKPPAKRSAKPPARRPR